MMIFVAINLVGLLVAHVVLARRRAMVRKAFSYCVRSASGEVYVTDPQTGTVHKLRDLLAQRISPKKDDRSPRQRRLARRNLRRALQS